MKRFISLFFILITTSFFAQKTFKVIAKSEDTDLFKGNINGSPITLFLKNGDIIDCDSEDTYIEGWYYYDK